MERRRKVLTNEYEEVTHEALLDAAARSGARVFPKVRVADVLDVESSGLTRDEYSYALKAHFDFVVERKGEPVAFAVEFDGPSHERDARTIARDALKNAICDKLGMPLLRIDAGYLKKIGRFTLLGWIAEVWFLSADFYAAQERGDVGPYEVFDYSAVLGIGYFEDGRLVEIDTADAAAAVEHMRRKKTVLTRPYDPFLPNRVHIHRLWEKGLCLAPVPEVLQTVDPRGYAVAIALIGVPGGGTVLGLAHCRSFRFPPVSSYELAEELAVVDVAEKLRQYQRGRYEPLTTADVASWRTRIARWKAASSEDV
jgi:hypothetical protein